VSGVTIPYGISGVAPRALLGNYNVFPADVANARSEDIVNASRRPTLTASTSPT